MSQKVKKAIEGLAAAIWERPERAEASFRATTVSEVDGFSTRASVRRFTVPLDEPRELALRLPVEVSGELTHVAPAEAEALRRTA